ncbi:glycosyltransferase family 2 protein [Candidatus Entotheonella palauensis]|nr:glycosyltransferase family A protein [Candidatus Entotheonella palauensis]
MSTPRVSIVTPTYNRAHLLCHTIDSVRAQSFSDFELLVMDDGSTDDTRELVLSYNDPRFVYCAREHTRHLSKLRNDGIRRARGAYVALLDSDDLWRADKLRRQVELLDQYEDAGMVVAGFEVFDSRGTFSKNLYGAEDGCAEYSVEWVFLPLIEEKLMLYPSTVLFRKSQAETVGLLNEEIRDSEHEFFFRLALHAQAVILRLPLVKIRKHEDNLSAQPMVESFAAIIHGVERFYASGAISRQLYTERMMIYHYRLGEIFLSSGDISAARRAFLACLRFRPMSSKAWRGFMSSLVKEARVSVTPASRRSSG